MANIAQLEQIFNITPIRQPILLVGTHGIGKSEILKQLLTKSGYTLITLFLGQASDAGDIIGLPCRIEKTIQKTRELANGETEVYDEVFYVTDFAPPKWWPLDENAKIAIFLDELNRGKPEIMQCVMDMVLNRRLNGRDLPKDTRIFGAMNPIDDDFYQVEDLDPAMLDRWNIYDFRPGVDEWINWAIDSKLHRDVIGFISKNNQVLDPQSGKDAKSNEIQPSRRSWERVSEIMYNIEKLKLNSKESTAIAQDTVAGIVGVGVSSRFFQFIREQKKGITPGQILLSWNEEIELKIRTSDITELTNINTNICMYLKENHKDFSNKDIGNKVGRNLELYVNTIDPEAMGHFFSIVSEAHGKKEVWVRVLMNLNPNIGQKFLEVIQK